MEVVFKIAVREVELDELFDQMQIQRYDFNNALLSK